MPDRDGFLRIDPMQYDLEADHLKTGQYEETESKDEERTGYREMECGCQFVIGMKVTQRRFQSSHMNPIPN